MVRGIAVDTEAHILRIVSGATSPTAVDGLLTLSVLDIANIPPSPRLRAVLVDDVRAPLGPLLALLRDQMPGDMLFIRTDDPVSQATRDQYTVCLVLPVAMPLEWVVAVITEALDHRPPPAVEAFALNLARDASTNLHHGKTIADALVHLRRLVPYDGANIALFEEGYAAVKYHHGYPEAIQLFLDNLRVPLSMPNYQRMVTTGEPLIIPDTTASDLWHPFHPGESIRSWMGVPIKKSNVVIGVVNFDSDQVNTFQPYQQDLALQVADHLALLVETHQLYNTLNEYTVLLSMMNRQNALLFTPLSSYNSLNEMCRHIAETVVSSFGKTDCGVLLVDENGTMLRRYARAGEFRVRAFGDMPLAGSGLVPEAARQAEMIYAPDVTQDPRYIANEPDTRSELVVPLVVNDWVLGVLDLQSNQPNAFSLRDREGLWAFAQYAALAIQNLLVVNTQRDLAAEMESYVEARTHDLEVSQRRVEAILNHAHDPILLLTATGHISQGNAAFERTLAMTEVDYYNTDLHALIASGQDAFDVAMQAATDTRNSQTFAARLWTRRTDYPVIDVEMTLAPVSAIVDDQQTFVCTIRDVTQFREVEQSLRRSLDRERELSQMKFDFIRTVHHQFNTPLSVIMSSTGILQMGVNQLVDEAHPMRARLTKHFDKINVEIRQLASMLEEAKLVSDTRRFTPNPVNIVKEVERAVQKLEADITVPQAIAVNVYGVDPEIYADSMWLQKALNHLLTNAVKFSLEQDRIDIEVHLAMEHVVIQVIDYGVGIPANELSSLFQPFFRGKGAATSRGVGLGLTIIKQAAELHGGTVVVTSEAGERTCFTLKFPRTPPRL